MKIGDVYYEKHTVVGISKRTSTVSETDVEIVNVLPIDVLDKIRAEIEKLDYLTIEDGSDGYDHYVDKYDVLKIINKYRVESEG